MSISTLSIKRPVLAIVLNLMILLFGAIGYTSLGVREFPSIDPPVVSVRTNYPGANASIIEAEITEPLEKVINSVEGIRTISSSSNQGSSSINVEFDLNVSMEQAANDIRDKVAYAARTLPKDIDGLPVVRKADADSETIIAMTLESSERSLLDMSDYAENVIAPRFETVPGVSGVRIWGMKRYAMRIWMEPDRMAAQNITTQDIKTALDRENIELPSGKIQGDQTELTVKTIGRFKTEEDFNNLIIRTDREKIIRLKDVGYAVLGAENEEAILRINNVPRVGVAISGQPGSNVLDIAAEVNRRLELLRSDLPEDLQIFKFLDYTVFVSKSIEEVKETLLIAVGLVILIIFFFFRDWIIAIRPLIDIPVSLIGSFFVMYLMGYSINVLTLLAIVLATGLVVDDGIVVTENIYKKIEAGMNPIQAAIKGSNEIMFAIVSTSITLAAVFLPVIFMEGFVGKLFQEFGVVLAAAVLISAFVSLTLTPMLNAYLVRKKDRKNKFYEKTEPFFRSLENGYKLGLQNFLTKRWLAFPLLAAVLALIYFVGRALPSELAPNDDRSVLRANMLAPEGSSYEFMDHYVQRAAEMMMEEIPESKGGIMTYTAPSFAGSGALNTAFARVTLVEPHERERSQSELTQFLNRKFKEMPDAKAFANERPTIALNKRAGLPVQYVIQAPDFEKLREYMPKFLDVVQNDPTFTVVDMNLKFNKPELEVTIDREKAKSIGVSVADVATAMQLAFAGQRFGYFNMNGRQYQIIGQFDRGNRDEPLDLKTLYVKNNLGQSIQLDNIVVTEEESSPPQLYHYNRWLSATVSAGLAPGMTISDGIKAMDAARAQFSDPAIRTELTGSSRDYLESSKSSIFSFVLALLLVYLILAAQFESFIDPFIIMLTVPLALAGAVFSLWLFDQTLNIFSQIGIIMLIGLVTKNGILIVEFANQLRSRGLSIQDAALEAATLRMRPIIMTTLATVLGAAPIALALGSAGASRMSMGIVVMGGLLFSLVLTLYVIPAMYIYLSRAKNYERRRRIEMLVETAN
ncbi:MAG: efflux RND transporter permease subunit [Saprospiraceae bacterium]|nr:efflux RND transporter permease subunit [Saprospiraceae bacterium]